ncbi:MAG: hypothetical protein KKD56_07290 [Acidobacteria bacterium]|nr:hypothetical protein [Acidobacteriota bacterium]MBU1473528.1 hypothetical protein [Acidobacteriota bacterium]
MKKAFALFGLWLFLLLPGWTATVYIKLAAGLSYAELTPINRNLEDWLAYHVRDVEVHPAFEFLEGSVPVLRTLFNFDGELVFSLNSRLSLSVGSGFIFGEVPQKTTETTVQKLVGTFINVYPVQISAIPLTLNVTYSLPLMKRLHAYVRAGGGLLWAKYVDRTGRRLSETKSFSYQTYNYATSRNPLFQGGGGFQFEVEAGIFLYVEMDYRAARISGLKGENKDGQQGTLFSYKEYDGQVDIWTSRFGVYSEAPSGEFYSDVKEAAFRLDGMTIRIGVMFRF